MAALDTAHKAPLIVASANGTHITRNNYTSMTVTPAEGVISIGGESPEGDFYVNPVGPGTATILITAGASSGSLEVTVSAAPLTVTLGEPVAL